METTPANLDEQVLDFCRAVCPGATPIYVPVRPVPGAERGECFASVARVVAGRGGAAEFGWAIWVEPGFLIEAERHAVWVSPDGLRIDVTPRPESRIVFLPGGGPVGTDPVPNVRRGLSADPRMARYLELIGRVDSFRLKLYAGTLPPQAFAEMVAIAAQAEALQMALGFGASPKEVLAEYGLTVPACTDKPASARNSPCPCGSGKKFKKCCIG